MIQLVTPPLQTVLLSEAKDHLRIIGTDEDTYIETLINTATEEVQQFTNRQLEEATYDLFLDAFPSDIDVPLPPLMSVGSIKYIDTDGVEQTLDVADYTVDTVSGRIVPAYGKSWPATRNVPNAVTVRFTAGYETVPAPLKSAVLLLVGDLYENREAQIVGTIIQENPAVERLLWPYRVFD